MAVYFEDINVGDAIPSLTTEPITETQLVRYAGASGDFNPIHTVHHIGEKAGFGGVIAHGMFLMGLAGRAVSDWAGVAPLRKFGVRFLGVTKPGQIITITGQVVEKFEAAGEHCVRCELTAVDQEDQQKIKGSFIVALPKKAATGNE